MGIEVVDQIGPGGALISDVDTRLSESQKNAMLLEALPGAALTKYAGERVVRFENHVILKKQITHLGRPWPAFKKRIQIPNKWLAVEAQARVDGLTPRFVGIYHYGAVTIFVDFDPKTYVLRKANNSAAHLATNDLYQAQVHGQFPRVDANGNRLTSIRSDQLADYLQGGIEASQPRLDVFRRFNTEFLNAHEVRALDAVQQMHDARWPDRFQAEWPGFYVEYRLDEFVRRERLNRFVEFQKSKQKHSFDFDLVFKTSGTIEFYGDLKASDITRSDAPGNDAEDIRRCIEETGRFWYVIYEHETHHARDNDDLATIEWNEWKRSVGFTPSKGFNPLSYRSKFKESVRFVRMKVLEVNEANFQTVLGDFNQGHQPTGEQRALKVMIKKKYIDNFLIYSSDALI